jgi:hypothetical protein
MEMSDLNMVIGHQVSLIYLGKVLNGKLLRLEQKQDRPFGVWFIVESDEGDVLRLNDLYVAEINGERFVPYRQ